MKQSYSGLLPETEKLRILILSFLLGFGLLFSNCKTNPTEPHETDNSQPPERPEEPHEPQPPVVPTIADIPAIDDAVTAFMDEFDVKGVSVAVTKEGRLVYAKGYGYADVATQTKTDTTSLFRIASLSKFITAAGIMKLIEENKLDMEDKVFGPGAIMGSVYGVSFIPKKVKEIRVRDLLHHEVGGWSNSGTIDPAFAKDELPKVDDLIKWAIYDQQLPNEPGTVYDYSNLGYMVLGQIIKKVSGMEYEDYIREHILEPSGVKNMKISKDTSNGRLPKEVSYYGPDGLVPYDTDGIIHRLGAAGGWIASAVDLTRILVHIDGFDTVPDILKPETITLMTTPSNLSDYACGFRINANSKNWWHSGGLIGTSTWLVRTPSGYTWSILTNTSSSDDDLYLGLNDLIWGAVNNPSTNWTDHDFF